MLAEQDQQNYRIVRLAGRPIIATPAWPLRPHLAGLAQYHPVTKKRAWLRTALRVAAIGRLDPLFTRDCASPLLPSDDFGFARWLGEIRSALGAPTSLATVIWPQLIGRKRIYVHLISPSGVLVAFCKVALDAHNAARLRTELDALTDLCKRDLKITRLPRILYHTSSADFHCIAYEPFPPDLIPLKHSWHELAPTVAELSGRVRRIRRAELERLDWWRRYLDGAPRYSPDFLHQVDETIARPVAICRVQGDAAPSNVFRSEAGIWICDWEFSSPAGPRRTDELSYYLAANHYQCLLRPVAALAACVRHFAPDGDRDSIGELVMAMAFLCGRKEPRALKLASRWRLLTPPVARQPDPRIGATSTP